MTVVVVTVDIYIIGIGHKDITKEKTPRYRGHYLHIDCLELTFAGLHALEPLMICVSAASTSTLRKPSTARSAKLDLPDFSNAPHFGHASVLAIVKAKAGVLTDVVIGVLAMSSRSVIGRRDAYGRRDA